MGVFFHVLSTGVGSGSSRTTRYIAEREKDLSREGPGSRPLFSDERDNLTYHKADWILDPYDGHPEKNELIHFSVMLMEEDFNKLGDDEKQKQARLRDVVREGMQGVATELNVEPLTWVAGIHHHSEHPHAHIVFNKEVIQLDTGRLGRIARIPKNLLPYKDTQDGKEVIVHGPIGERFLKALEKQQTIQQSKNKQPELTPAQRWEELFHRHHQAHQQLERSQTPDDHERRSMHSRGFPAWPVEALESRQVSVTWRSDALLPDDPSRELRFALGKRLTLEFRLAFAEAWHERAIQYGTTFRFEVVDESVSSERRISELDVRRRAAARAARVSQGDLNKRNEALDLDLAKHSETLKVLAQLRENKIEALEKDIGSLEGNLAKMENNIARHHQMPGAGRVTPLVSRDTLSELQEQAMGLNLVDRVTELAREHRSPSRTDSEAASLVAQFNVTQAEFMAKEARLQNFDASVHLTTYEIGDERWSLAQLDKQVARRREDSKLIPKYAARLDLRSLIRLNYSAAEREKAAADVRHLSAVREQIVEKIEARRAPLVADRDLARDKVDVLETAFRLEHQWRKQNGLSMPEPKYERAQILSLEGSAEVLRDEKLLRKVHEWEKTAARSDPEINWEGRAIAREITSRVALEEQAQRLEKFLESKKSASLQIGEHRTGTLREVEARTLTDYVVRALTETQERRKYRNDSKLAASEHHNHLVSDLDLAEQYHQQARDLASETKNRDPQFTDKEKINLEIYAERQTDDQDRQRYLDLAHGQANLEDREISISRGR